MLSALFSFLGGSVFRMIWGEVSAYLTARQQHSQEMDRMKLQADLEAAGWLEAVKATGRAIGVAWVDAWNAGIRPATATWALVMLTLGEFAIIKISDSVVQVAGAALGIYLADRALLKRGK